MSVIAPTDGDSVTVAVSESTQVPGVYYFTVPSAFFLSNGVGEYFVVQRVANDLVSAAGGAILHVHQYDLDSLAGAGLSSTQSTMLLEMYRLLGLDPTKPLIVDDGADTRTAGAEIEQSVVTVDDVTTVTRL
jgi:hypothetical protein